MDLLKRNTFGRLKMMCRKFEGRFMDRGIVSTKTSFTVLIILSENSKPTKIKTGTTIFGRDRDDDSMKSLLTTYNKPRNRFENAF
jgi:hypothetical protein